MNYYMVEQVSRDFSCPVRFETEHDALVAARRWKANGAFRVNVYRMTEGNPSGVLVEVL